MADDFLDLFADWLADVVQLETYLGQGFEGKQYAPPSTVEDVLIDETSRLVHNPDGNEVLSETTLYVPTGRGPFKLDDRVTVRGRTSTVLRVANPAVYGLFNFEVVNLS